MKRLVSLWRNEAVFLLLVGLFALSLRLGYNALYVGPGYVPELDAREYSDIATNLAAGQGYRLANGNLTAVRPPLFPLLLAGVYWLRGSVDYQAGLALQALIGVGITLASYAVGTRVYGAAAGRIAAVIVASYPLLIFAGGALLSEPLFALAVTLAMAGGLRVLARPTVGNYLAWGIVLGLAWLARPNGMFLLPFLLGWLLVADRQTWGRRLLGSAVVLLATLAVVAPWVARNYLAFGKLIPASTMGGSVWFGSYNDVVLQDPALHGDWVAPCKIPGAGWSCRLDEVGRDAAWQRLGWEFIRGHLPDLPRMAWWRFINFWHLYRFEHGFPANVGFYYYAVVAVLALVGACRRLSLRRARREWRRAGVLWAVVLCFTVNAMVFWGGFRMRTPAEPALIVLAAGVLAAGWRFGSRTPKREDLCCRRLSLWPI